MAGPIRGVVLPRKLSRSTSWTILVVTLLLWVILGLVGFWVGHSLAPTHSTEFASGLFGVAVGSFVWVACCWVAAFGLRSALRKRGFSERSDL
jgi:hypothetical protein